MSLTNNEEMAKAIFNKSCIKVKKCFFGLITKVIYTLTDSPVVGAYQEYDASNGEKAKLFLSLPPEMLRSTIQKDGRVKPAENGKFCMSLCYSRDHRFAAFLLSQYINFDYRPVGEIRFAEGDEAETLLEAFVK